MHYPGIFFCTLMMSYDMRLDEFASDMGQTKKYMENIMKGKNQPTEEDLNKLAELLKLNRHFLDAWAKDPNHPMLRTAEKRRREYYCLN